jgi:hypothetical protein
MLLAGLAFGASANDESQASVRRTVGTGQIDRAKDRANARPSTGASVRRPSSAGKSDKPWSIEDALPDNSRAVQSALPEAKKPELGRMPLRSGGGTIGVETDPQLKSDEFAGGSHTPTGLVPKDQQKPKYFGLSVSVPTSDKSMIPSGPALPWSQD